MFVPGRHTRCPGFAVLVSFTCHCRNLDVDSGVSLPCLCTVNFLIANISMNSSFTARIPPEKGVKKIAHAIFHIVSRKSVAKLQPHRKLTKYSDKKV